MRRGIVVGSVARAIKLLLLLAEEKELGVRDIARRLGVDSATGHRLVNTLASYRFVEQNPESKKYRLGIEVARIGYVCFKNLDVREKARPFLEELQQLTGETVMLVVRSGSQAICLDRIESSHTLRIHSTIGARLPLHAGAAAKALLAYMPEEEREAVINSGNLLRYTERTITDPDELKAECHRIRQQGYSFSLEEMDVDVVAVGAPLFNYRSQVEAAISVVGPKGRVDDNKLRQMIAHVQQIARKISFELGYRGGADKQSTSTTPSCRKEL